MSTPETLIDAALFLGMHSREDRIRTAAKNFFVTALERQQPLAMNLEQVGLCDDMVWRQPREIQDAYYPFMDNLHSELRLTRTGYRRTDLDAALGSPSLAGLPLAHALLLAPAVRHGRPLHTASARLAALHGRRVTTPPAGPERSFPPALEKLYATSLALRIDLADLDDLDSR
jgi:hypothetical protein